MHDIQNEPQNQSLRMWLSVCVGSISFPDNLSYALLKRTQKNAKRNHSCTDSDRFCNYRTEWNYKRFRINDSVLFFLLYSLEATSLSALRLRWNGTFFHHSLFFYLFRLNKTHMKQFNVVGWSKFEGLAINKKSKTQRILKILWKIYLHSSYHLLLFRSNFFSIEHNFQRQFGFFLKGHAWWPKFR